jgi:ATP-dependent Clp protease protease subunit
MNKILAINTGKDEKTIEQDTERDNFISAIEALEYGLIDKVITKKES